MSKIFNFENIKEDYLKSFKLPTIQEFSILENKYNALNLDFVNFGLNADKSSNSCVNTLYNIMINEQSENFDAIVKYVKYISKTDFLFLNQLNSFLLKIPIIDFWMNSFLNKFNMTLNSIFSSIYDIEQTIKTELGFLEQHTTDISDIKECFSYSIRNLELDLFALYFKQEENRNDNALLEDIQNKIYSINLARLNLVNSLTQTTLIENRIFDFKEQLSTLLNVTLPILKNTLTIIKNVNNKSISAHCKDITHINNNSLENLHNIIVDNLNHNFINPKLLNKTTQIFEEQIISIQQQKNENYKKNVDFFKNIDIIYKIK